MKMICLGSSSAQNGYLLVSSTGETLILECGVKFSEVKKALDFDITGIVAALVTHKHYDHSKYINEYLHSGITILSSEDVFNAHQISLDNYGIRLVQEGKGFKIGDFKVIPFLANHDVICFGYHVYHPEMGNLLFATDTFMLEQRFSNLNFFMIEANFSDAILEENISVGKVHPAMRPRLLTTHMELQTLIGLLKANDLSQVNLIILLHLSFGNGDQDMFVREVVQATGKTCLVASKGKIIDIGINPY